MKNLRFLSLFLLFVVTTSHAQSNVTITSEAWRADLRYFASEVPRRHANFYNTITPTEFAQAVNDLDNAIPFKTDAEIHAAMLRLAAMAKDGHTSVYFSANGAVPYFRRFPIWMQWFQGGYVTNVSHLTEESGRGGKLNYRRVRRALNTNWRDAD